MAKTFFISGAASGIGKASTRYLIKNGHSVFGTDFNSQAMEATFKGEFKQQFTDEEYSRLGYALIDVSNDESVKAAVQECVLKFGHMDVLVNNAGVNSPYWTAGVRMDEVPISDWERVIGTNLTGTFRVSQHCIKHLDQSPTGSGVIINISSCRSQQSEPHCESYAASKAGLVGLTHGMAVSLGPKIRVHCLSPGWIDIRHERLPPEDKNVEGGHTGWAPEWGYGMRDIDHEQHPVGRLGRGEDIAVWLEFLGAKETGFATGGEIVVDGGYSKRLHYA
ncbi:short chain dehydrogenase [Aspergillus sclerotialis]|uniref:Short chain dehydrogenase n=1 Tax=Aspergillus sclerotialis TaxID=2070753 RepID=A0A3A2ZQR4_9EURO|nr:short chain dehydrogenase [Aspergillus sclerotialis]